MPNYEINLRAVGSIAYIVDEYNSPETTGTPTLVLGMSADLALRIFRGEDTEAMNAEDFSDIAAWNFAIGNDYKQETEPQLRINTGITVDNDGLVHIPIENTNTVGMAEKLGGSENVKLICELAGYKAGETTPSMVIQFQINIRNRIDLEGGDQSVPVDSSYLTVAQVNALVAGKADATTVNTALALKANTADLFDYIPASQKGANGGVASLDENGKVPIEQLPASSISGSADENAVTALIIALS